MGRTLLAALCALAWSANLAAQETPPPAVSPLEERAELTDVSFVDRLRGWAVGDRGVVWQTVDGGQTWTRLPTGVSFRLEAAHFLPDGTGWIAGGWAWPYSSDTQGMVLSTRDGGQTWSPSKGHLPWLHSLRFSDARTGWAVGRSSELAPGAVYTTNDGGNTWNPRTVSPSGEWLAADFDASGGALLGSAGLAIRVERGSVATSTTPKPGIRRPRRIKLANQQGWAVGDGGLIWRTEDGGRTWQPPRGKLPAEAAGFDWYALDVAGSEIWAAGFPGTHLLASSDAGATWRLLPTGQTLPLRGLERLDAEHAVAVGALGTILTTADAGRTWQVRQQGAPRAAALGIFADGQSIPLEFFGRIMSEGYPGVVHCLGRREFDDPRAGPVEIDRARAALSGVGGCAVSESWRFPVRQRGLSIPTELLRTAWQRASNGPTVPLEEELAAVLRCWRPAVVVTHAVNAESEPFEAAIQQALLKAVELAAADGPRGGPPWKVERVYAALPAGRLGPITLSTAAFMPRLGRSLSDLSAAGRGILAASYEPPSDAIGFQLLYDRGGKASRQRDDFLVGLEIGELAAPLNAAPTSTEVATLHRAATQQRNVRALLSRAAKQPTADARWLSEVGGLVGELDRAAAGELLFQLAHGYHRQGRQDLASETLGLLTGSYGDHPLAGPSLVWLLQHRGAAEPKLRDAQRPQAEIQQTAASVTFGVSPGAIAKPAAMANPRAVESEQRRLQQLGNLAAQLARIRPALAAAPSVRFPLIALDGAGQSERTVQSFEALLKTRPRDAWSDCAAAEISLLRGDQTTARDTLLCPRAAKPPHLDGRLDDEVWANSAEAKLASAWRDDAEWPTTVRMASDDRFLYLAATCRRAPGAAYAEPAATRPRDANLAQQDRLELCLDLDRDRATWCQWTVDARGWTAETCWNDRTWNPTWFVAHQMDETEWTVEAAIAWSDLGSAAPPPGTVWALGLQRVVPGVGFQSWTKPAAVDILPEGFGLVRFE
jgi:photosystem II stability/assembly factor-like uncharacterized protein